MLPPAPHCRLRRAALAAATPRQTMFGTDSIIPPKREDYLAAFAHKRMHWRIEQRICGVRTSIGV
jgi:hypothetical protein